MQQPVAHSPVENAPTTFTRDALQSWIGADDPRLGNPLEHGEIRVGVGIEIGTVEIHALLFGPTLSPDDLSVAVANGTLEGAGQVSRLVAGKDVG